jgi:LysM repeat protein
VSGDTLSGIAQQYSTTVQRLQDANKMTSKSVLRVGKTLIIPAG